MFCGRYFFIHGGFSIVMLVFREVLYVLFSSQLLKLQDLSFPAEIVHRKKKLVVLLGSGFPSQEKVGSSSIVPYDWLYRLQAKIFTLRVPKNSTTIIANITNIHGSCPKNCSSFEEKTKKKDISSTSKLTSLKELLKKTVRWFFCRFA